MRGKTIIFDWCVLIPESSYMWNKSADYDIWKAICEDLKWNMLTVSFHLKIATQFKLVSKSFCRKYKSKLADAMSGLWSLNWISSLFLVLNSELSFYWPCTIEPALSFVLSFRQSCLNNSWCLLRWEGNWASWNKILPPKSRHSVKFYKMVKMVSFSFYFVNFQLFQDLRYFIFISTYFALSLIRTSK